MAILGKWPILGRPPYFNNQCSQGNHKLQEMDGVNLTNLTGLPMRFSVEATDPGVNYEVKPSRGIGPPSETCRTNFTALGIPLVKQEEKTLDFIFEDSQYNRPDPREEDIIQVPRQEAAEEVLEKNSEAALETLREAIELYPDGFLLLCHPLVNHLLDRKEGVKLDLQEAIVRVPTYTKERLKGEQMIVEFTKNQRFVAKVCLTPFYMLRPDGDVDVIVIVDSFRFGVKSNGTDSYPDHFLQNCKFVVRPAGKWSESFPDGCGLIDWRPGNEINTLMVQTVSAYGITAGVNLGANPNAGLYLSRNKSRGTTFPAFGPEKATSDGHAYVFEYKLNTFEDGSSAQDLSGRRFYRIPKVPEAVRNQVDYPNLGQNKTYAGTWRVPYATAVELRNELGFTISLKAKLPAVLRCRKFSPTHWFKPPKHKEVVMEQETRRMCVFGIAGLERFI